MGDLRLESGRLLLLAAGADDLGACADGDRAAFAAVTGAEPPDPFSPPPETGDVLGYFRDAVEADPDLRPWFFQWVVDRASRRLLGSAGFAGRPNEAGHVYVGYSTYPPEAGKGYASEAAAALVAWALRQPGVTAVRATIKPDNAASRRVAAKAGLRQIGEMATDADGLVEVWEAARTDEDRAPNRER